MDKKSKEAESKRTKYFESQHQQRLKHTNKRDEVIENQKHEKVRENKFGWRRLTEYDSEQKERYNKWQSQELQRSADRKVIQEEMKQKRKDVLARLEEQQEKDEYLIQVNLERINRKLYATSKNYDDIRAKRT